MSSPSGRRWAHPRLFVQAVDIWGGTVGTCVLRNDAAAAIASFGKGSLSTLSP